MAVTDGRGIVPQRRRADARRSIEAIVSAARVLFSERPDASMEDVAAAAGLARQTVYAHFTSREALIHAVVVRACSGKSLFHQLPAGGCTDRSCGGGGQ